jgi:hypothetical protein
MWARFDWSSTLPALIQSLTRSGRVIGNGSVPERAIFLYGGPLANTASPHAALVREANTVRRVACCD